VAIASITIEELRDYVNAALFFLLVPPLTLGLRRFFDRRTARFDHRAKVLFAVPYFLAPLLFLTAGKIGWVLLLPVVLSLAMPYTRELVRSRLWIRSLLRPEMRPFHALIVTEGVGWIFFRGVVLWKRIAHIPTLFLEVMFVALFIGLFWLVALYIARLAQARVRARPRRDVRARRRCRSAARVSSPRCNPDSTDAASGGVDRHRVSALGRAVSAHTPGATAGERLEARCLVRHPAPDLCRELRLNRPSL